MEEDSVPHTASGGDASDGADDAVSFHARGAFRLKAGEYSLAVEDFSCSLGLRPNHVETLYLRASAWFKQNRFSEAFADLSAVLTTDPSHSAAAMTRAACLNHLGFVSMALDDYSRALSLPSPKSQESSTPVGAVPPSTNSGKSAPQVLSHQTSSSNNHTLDDPSVPQSTNSSQPSSSNVSLADAISRLQAASTHPTQTTSTSAAQSSTISQINIPTSPTPSRPLPSPAQPSIAALPSNLMMDVNGGLSLRRKAAATVAGGISLSSPSQLDSAPKIEVSPTDQRPSIAPFSPTTVPLDPQTSAVRYLETAKEYEANSQFNEALSFYARAISSHASVDAYLGRALVHFNLEHYDEALGDVESILSLQWDSIPARQLRVDIFTALQRFDLAINEVTQILEFNPTLMEWVMTRANLCFKAGQFDKCIVDYTTLIQEMESRENTLNEDDLHALYLLYVSRGRCFEELQRFEELDIDLCNALSIHSLDWELYVRRAELYDQQQRPQEALKILDQIDSLMIHNSAIAALRGKLLAKLNRYDEAVQELSTALELGPGIGKETPRVALHYQRGVCYRVLDRWVEAIQDLNYVLHEDEDNLQALQHRGHCLRKTGHLEEAIDDYARILKLQPSVRVYTCRAFLLAQLNRHEEAVRDYTSAIEIDPECVHAYHNRGIALDKLGHINEAIADFSKVFEFDAATQGKEANPMVPPMTPSKSPNMGSMNMTSMTASTPQSYQQQNQYQQVRLPSSVGTSRPVMPVPASPRSVTMQPVSSLSVNGIGGVMQAAMSPRSHVNPTFSNTTSMVSAPRGSFSSSSGVSPRPSNTSQRSFVQPMTPTRSLYSSASLGSLPRGTM